MHCEFSRSLRSFFVRASWSSGGMGPEEGGEVPDRVGWPLLASQFSVIPNTVSDSRGASWEDGLGPSPAPVAAQGSCEVWAPMGKWATVGEDASGRGGAAQADADSGREKGARTSALPLEPTTCITSSGWFLVVSALGSDEGATAAGAGRG